MQRHVAWGVVLGGVSLALWGACASRAETEGELEMHLAELQSQVDDPTVRIEKRQQLALEVAATLDRAAQAAATAGVRRARWADAIRRLDRFREANPGLPRSDLFQFQAAVYLWAKARSWSRQWELAPTDDEAHAHAVEDLDAAIVRLRAVHDALRGATDVFAQNVRFRLAEALADRAALDPEGAVARSTREREALRVLGPPVTEPTLQGFAHLLRSDLLSRLGEADRALEEVEAASRATPPPPSSELLEARVAALIGLKRFEDALQAIGAARADEAVKGRLVVRVRLAQRAGLPPGEARRAVEAALFHQIKTLRESSPSEARPALLDLTRGLVEPDASQGPDAWDALAEGWTARGDLVHAAALEDRGAERAAALGRTEQAAELRLRAGALLFQAGKFLEADALLSRVADDPQAGASRPKAGLLRTLARGRALALRLPGASRQAYVAALEAQIRTFPDDPSTGEARWLLGRLKAAMADPDAAQALWSAIPRHHPRWLDARLAMAALRQDELDTQRINHDRAELDRRYREAREFLTATLEQARTDTERAALELGLARLEVTPDVGHPDEARLICEHLLRSASQADRRDQARRLHILALAQLDRFAEAEHEAHAEVDRARPASLLDTARLLDQVASESESDLRLRRFGLILRTLLARVLEHADALTPDQRAEAQLRMARAQLFSGDQARARRALDGWDGNTQALGDRLLKDLADTYVRLDAFEMAADVQRLRMQYSPPGSLPWFAARYGLALAYYRSGRSKEARQLIDATAILHPDLGGGDLRNRFVRLRQRLEPGE